MRRLLVWASLVQCAFLITALSPSEQQFLASLQQQMFISVASCDAAGVTCSGVWMNESIVSLELACSVCKGSLPSISGLRALTALKIVNGPSVAGTLPSLSGNLELQTLEITQCKLSGTLPSWAGNTKLQKIYLNDNTFSGSLPSLSTLADLSWLAVFDNQLTSTTGPCPRCVSGLEICQLSTGDGNPWKHLGNDFLASGNTTCDGVLQTDNPTSSKPTTSPTKNPTTSNPTTALPTLNPTTNAPTIHPSTSKPTSNPTTANPTLNPISNAPTSLPITSNPSTSNPTRSPTENPTTRSPSLTPSRNPTTASPTLNPTTHSPTPTNQTLHPTHSPTSNSTAAPTPHLLPNTGLSITEQVVIASGAGVVGLLLFVCMFRLLRAQFQNTGPREEFINQPLLHNSQTFSSTPGLALPVTSVKRKR